MIKLILKIRSLICFIFLFMGFFFFSAQNLNAQFIDLQLEIEPKLEARTLRQFNFGTLNANTGRRFIGLGDVNMGIFSITALENQALLLNLQSPSELRHNNPGVKDFIPLELQMRYGYSLDNPRNSQPIIDFTTVNVESNNQIGPWSRIYLFIYGSIDIGNVEEGTYSNQIVLQVEYI